MELALGDEARLWFLLLPSFLYFEWQLSFSSETKIFPRLPVFVWIVSLCKNKYCNAKGESRDLIGHACEDDNSKEVPLLLPSVVNLMDRPIY